MNASFLKIEKKKRNSLFLLKQKMPFWDGISKFRKPQRIDRISPKYHFNTSFSSIEHFTSELEANTLPNLFSSKTKEKTEKNAQNRTLKIATLHRFWNIVFHSICCFLQMEIISGVTFSRIPPIQWEISMFSLSEKFSWGIFDFFMGHFRTFHGWLSDFHGWISWVI